MELKNKNIVLISPQSWGTMFIAKHHYAVELGKRGNNVFFINPPDQTSFGLGSLFKIKKIDQYPGVFLVDHKLFFPYILRFHLPWLFKWLMQIHTLRLIRWLDKKIDIVWSFDLSNLYPLVLFPNGAYKIFHPVDEPSLNNVIEPAIGSNIIFSVTREILDKYKDLAVPKHLINHGVSEEFFKYSDTTRKMNSPIRVGLSGNFTRPDVDRAILLEIIRENPGCIFEFWGSYQPKDANLSVQVGDSDFQQFIEMLKNSQNVFLHGPVKPSVLASEIGKMDAFLICYDIEKDPSKGTNYHKIMEYLSTGKIIISNNVTSYVDYPDLVIMNASRKDNHDLPDLFLDTIKKLDYYNSIALQEKRINFAHSNQYPQQLERIEKLL